MVELLVRASWRRQGIAATLHDLVLENRPEERATLVVLPAATRAQKAFRKWGWRKLTRTSDPHHGSAVYDVLVTAPPATPVSSASDTLIARDVEQVPLDAAAPRILLDQLLSVVVGW